MSNQEALSVCRVHHSIHPLRDQNWAHTWIINRAADSVSTLTSEIYTYGYYVLPEFLLRYTNNHRHQKGKSKKAADVQTRLKQSCEQTE